MINLEALIKAAATRGTEPEYSTILEFCTATRTMPEQFCNDYAVWVAKGFYEERLTYEFCDGAMNYLWGFMTTPPVFGEDKNIPEPAFEIYRAFDEGEYHHQGDPSAIDPVEKYTKPLVEELFRGGRLS
ncbi:hypothetical protein [Marinobacter salexigens]|uniref:hypothetical protein n=1 Tax=Marinobacter salexigens TaxID=1925763 RepID=UPI000C285A70|nr:hypothetical protein [Marinobacter salexigens]